MAYGLRLQIEYKDRNDILTTINIYQDGYTGEPDTRTASAGAKFDWGDQAGKENPCVYGSSCTIYFTAEVDFEFTYLFSSDAQKHMVEILKAGNLYWFGYIEPDSWGEPLQSVPYNVQCTAYDGLGFLKNSPFLDASEEVYTGKKTIFDILKICLLKTGLDLTIHTGIDWQEELQTANTDLTKVHQLNCDAFIDLNCYEVLEKILPECRIFQRSGRWWVISNTNFYRYTIDYFTTTPEGVVTSESLVSAADGWWFEGLPKMLIIPALKHLNVIQNFGLNSNLILNGSFEKFNAESNTFENWIKYNDVQTIRRILNDDNDKYIIVLGREYPYWQSQQIYRIANSLAIKASASSMKLSMSFAALGAEGKSLNVYIRVKLTGESTIIHRLVYETSATESKLNLTWVHDDPVSLHPRYQMIPLQSHSRYSEADSLYMQAVDTVACYPLEKITDHFENFSAVVAGIPEDGLLEISLYDAYTPYAEILGVCYTGINVELLTDEEEQYPETTSYKVISDEKNNFVPEDLELLIGDYPDISNSDIMFRGGISLLDNTHTTGWRQIGTTTYYTFAEFISLMRAAGQKIPRQSYQVRLTDIIPTLNMTIWDAANSDKRLLENGITYDDRMQAVDGRYVELFAVDFTGLTVIQATEFDKTGTAKGESTTTIITAKPINAADRVTIIDDNGAIVSKPAFLDNKYYEVKELDPELDDGLGRVQPANKGLPPYALDFDAALPSFSIQAALVETNVDDIANKVKFNAGTITMHQALALDKTDRKAVLDAEELYDPSVVVTIPETIVTIADNNRRAVYIKILKTELIP